MSVLLAIVVLATACSSDSAGPGVAALGSSSAPGASASPSGDIREQQLAYAQCMRDHGIADFPDPDAQGHLTWAKDRDDRPQFNAADEPCPSLLPQPSEEKEQGLAWLLEVAECTREHGFPDFSDPEPGQPLSIDAGANPELDPNSTEFRAALEACKTNTQTNGGTP